MTQQSIPPHPYSISPHCPERVDYLISTDGASYYTDYHGGYAAIIYNFITHKVTSVQGCATNTSVERAELMGIIEGVRYALEAHGHKPGYKTAAVRPSIHIVSDRLDLVNYINGEWNLTADRDLWVLLSLYRGYCYITAEHVPRCSTEAQNLADLLSSAMRVLLCEFITTHRDTYPELYENPTRSCLKKKKTPTQDILFPLPADLSLKSDT